MWRNWYIAHVSVTGKKWLETTIWSSNSIFRYYSKELKAGIQTFVYQYTIYNATIHCSIIHNSQKYWIVFSKDRLYACEFDVNKTIILSSSVMVRKSLQTSCRGHEWSHFERDRKKGTQCGQRTCLKDLGRQERDTGNCQGLRQKLPSDLVGFRPEGKLSLRPTSSSPGLPNSFHWFPYIVSTFIPFVFT